MGGLNCSFTPPNKRVAWRRKSQLHLRARLKQLEFAFPTSSLSS
jgi:hypothetical protein